MGLFSNLSIFGYQLVKDSDRADKGEKLETFELEKDTAVEIEQNQMGGVYAYAYDSVAIPTTEIETIKTYRNIARNADVDLVLNEIRNEVFIFDVPGKKAVDVGFPSSSAIVSKAVQKKIHDEFDELYSMMDFRERGLEYFDKWYIDGKIHLHKVVDKDKKAGIKQIVLIDPLKIKRVKEVPKRDEKGVYDLNKVVEYFVYTDTPEAAKVGSGQATIGLKIQKDAITYCDSGIYEDNKVQGFLHKAIVPFNNLKLLEESLLIYRVSRAPERRVIYVDVGNLPKNKAEQYVRDLMNKFRNKLVYDSKTGGLADKKNVLSMMEDYWLPRRDGGKGTEITTLPGGENLGVIADVEYFSNKLSDALNVPSARFSPQAPTFVFGKGTEVNRDEYRFKKFIDRLRNRFITIFEDILRTQLLLKNIITEADWADIKDEMFWVYAEDNNFVEFKESETLNNRINTLAQIDPFVGKYFSREWALQTVMKMTDKEIAEMDKQIDSEAAMMAKREAALAPNEAPNPDEPQSTQPEGVL